MRRFTLCSAALTIAVTLLDDSHTSYCDRSTAYVLQYYVLKFQLHSSKDVEWRLFFAYFLITPPKKQLVRLYGWAS